MRRHAARLAGTALILGTAAAPLAGQTVFELQGGGSSLFDGYGGLLNFWNPHIDGWAGVGWLDGWRFGAFGRTEWGRDTVRFGNDVLAVRFPTDLFGSGTNVLVQGASLVRARERALYRAFAGATAAGVSAPLFSAARPERPFGVLQGLQPLSSTLNASGSVIVAQRQSAFLGLEWKSTPQFTASGVGGVGSNRPYGAATALYDGKHVDFRVAAVASARGFQRVFVPAPTQTEVDGINFDATLHPIDAVYVSVGRQQFRRDSLTVRSQTAAAWNTTIGGTFLGTRLMVTGFRSDVDSLILYSMAVGAGRSFGERFSTEYYHLRHHGPVNQAQSSVVRLREVISRRLQASQHITFSRGAPQGGLGGTLLLPFGSVSVDYQLQHMPFDPSEPFRQSVVVSAALQLGDYRTSVSTQVNSAGRVAYSATGSTFLYFNQMGGVQPQTIGVSLERFMVRGIVRDEEGNPVEGAAIDIEGQAAYTNRSGEFFVRVPRPREYRVQVLLDEFLTVERYMVVSIPETAPAAKAADAVPAAIVLRRVVNRRDTPAATTPADTMPGRTPEPGTPRP